jgi:hypothetical protein
VIYNKKENRSDFSARVAWSEKRQGENRAKKTYPGIKPGYVHF